MNEESHTVQRPKRNRGNPRQRRNCSRRDQPRISVRIGTLNIRAADHVTPRSTDGGDETTSTHEIKPERLLLENDPHMEDIDEEDEEDYVEIFMTENGLRTRPLCRAEAIKKFCHSKPLQELVSSYSDISSEKRCLVDETANDGSSSTRIGKYEPLTNREFYHRRKKNRFHPTTSRELNADRSLSFAENPDRHTIGAIMLTAPTLQVIPLRDFFYYYTSFRPHIRFSKRPRGFFNFAHAQQFHLPFYAWRRARQEPKDTRTKTDGSPLRRVFNMQFLRGKPSRPVGEVDYLCEGQISVLITAFRERVTGYCFVDTYCQSQNERQTAQSYCQSDSDEGDLNVQPDPFTSGICDSNQPIRDPNHYFLTVLDCQLQVFRDEWTNTVHQISSMVQDYTDNFPYPFRKPHKSSAKDAERPSVWLRATRRELTRLIRCLKKTLQCWGNCASEEQLSALYEQLGLHSIPETISDLKICLRDLKETLELCDEHERNLNLDNIDAQQDNNEAQQHASQLQTTAAQNSQKATDFLLHIISPITAAAAILSMQEKAIPTFLGPNKLSFFVLVPILIIFVVAVFKVIHSWDRIFPALCQRLKWHQVERHRTEDIELADIEP